MAVLVDANILVRVLDRQSQDFPTCVSALRAAKAKRGEFLICAQVMIEFWAVTTRPLLSNGLGLTPAQADHALDEFMQFLPLLPEPPDIAIRWRQLVRQHAVSGKPVHDARIVAIMETHNIRKLLTLNARDFARYPSIQIVSPHDVADLAP